MTRRRPTVILVVAICNLIFGGLAVVGLLCFGALVTFMAALIGFFSLQGGSALPPQFKLNYAIFNGGLVLLTGALLLVSGIGLLRMKPWARCASVISGGIFILIPVAGVVYNILYFNPAMEQLRRDVQAQQEKAIQADLDRGMVVNRQLQQSGQEPEFNGMISLVGLLPVMVYGLMLLVVMFLPDVSASFGRA